MELPALRNREEENRMTFTPEERERIYQTALSQLKREPVVVKAVEPLKVAA